MPMNETGRFSVAERNQYDTQKKAFLKLAEKMKIYKASEIRLILVLSVHIISMPVFSQRKVEKVKPNIIFILVDDQGYGDLGVFFQHQRAKANDRSKPWQYSPNLDKLAAGGAMLTQHYCAAPVCAPSRASILLGVSQGHANIRDNQFDKALEDNYNMPSTLRNLGYSTALIGKWGLQGDNRWDTNGSEWPAHPLKRGFEYSFSYIRHNDGHEHYPKEGVYEGPKEVWENYTNVSPGLDKCYTADLWTAVAKKYIVDHEKGGEAGKPFFLYLAYETPHAVLELPTEKYPDGGGLNGGIQWLGEKGHMINTAEGQVDSYINPDYSNATYDDDHNPNTPEAPWPETYKRYATANRRIDYAVGDIKQLLKDLKIDSNTVIVYTSDNGPSIESYLPKNYVPNHPDFFESYGPFDGIKRDDWEGGVRVATIANWPGHIPAGKVVKSPSISYDWPVTFLDMAGEPAPERMDGVSLLPSLTGADKQRSSLIYNEYYQNGKTPDFEDFSPNHRGRKRNQMQLIRIGDYVGVRYDVQSPADNFEIYDVVNDPGEKNNLLSSNKNPERIKEKNTEGLTKADLNKLDAVMKARVLQVRRANSSAPRPYDSTLISPMKANVTPGIAWKTYSGNFIWIPQVETLKLMKSGYASRPGLNKSQQNIRSILTFEGYINVPRDGEYTFFLQSGTKAFLRIHDAQVIDADFGFKRGSEYKGSISLKAGLHPFRLYSKGQTTGKSFLKFEWSGPGIQKEQIPDRIFFKETSN